MADEFDPVRTIIINGRPHYQWVDGFTFPVISGGDGSGDGGGDGSGDGGGDSGGSGDGGGADDKGGSGGSGGADDKGGAGGGTDGDEPLGEAGKRALEAERKAKTAAEKKAKAAEAELEKLRKDQMSEQERAVAEAKSAGEAEATKKANERILRSEIKALAAKKLHDPADAVVHLNIDEFTVGDDGEIDAEAIKAAIDKLLEEKPYLAAKTGSATGPGSADGGPQGESGGESDKDLGELSMEEYRKARRKDAAS